jgi:hypothetical protein
LEIGSFDEKRGGEFMPTGVKIISLVILEFIFLVGLVNAIYPRVMWKVFESWKAKEEPSNTYFLKRRIVGIISMLIVTSILLFPYIMSKQ